MTTAGDVERSLSADYPDSAMDWVKHAQWSGPKEVPLSAVNFANQKKWNAWHEPARVAKFAKRIAKRAEDGRRVKPVVLADTPDGGTGRKLMIVDGHHRSLAYKHLNKPIWGYVGKVPTVEGPWQEMHARQRAAGDRATTDDYAAKSGSWAAWEHDQQQAQDLTAQLELELAGAVDTRAIAEQWAQVVATQGLHPGAAESFLMTHVHPVRLALETALAPAWEQAWNLGSTSATQLVKGFGDAWLHELRDRYGEWSDGLGGGKQYLDGALHATDSGEAASHLRIAAMYAHGDRATATVPSPAEPNKPTRPSSTSR